MVKISNNLAKDKHGFFGRLGGVSKGRFSSLNCNLGSADNSQSLEQNYQIIASHFGLDSKNIAKLYQGLTADVVYIEKASKNEIIADGMVTKEKNLLLLITTADCLPILLADYQNGVIGAAHGGWRGIQKGIIPNIIKLMIKNGANLENIIVAIGPCIQQKSFEVGKDVFNAFNCPQFFIPAPKEGFYMFNLSGFAEEQLKNLGIKNINNLKIDTYSNEEKYFSFRRETHKKSYKSGDGYGTQASCIAL